MPKSIICDFDGTITEDIPYKPYQYGKPNKDIIEKLQLITDKYPAKIIIWTSRSWAEQYQIAKYCEDNGIPYDTIICCKPIADYYLDTKNILKEDINSKGEIKNE